MADVGIGCILVRCVVDVALAVWRMPTGSAGGDTSHPTHSSSAACVWLGPSSIVGLLHRSSRPTTLCSHVSAPVGTAQGRCLKSRTKNSVRHFN